MRIQVCLCGGFRGARGSVRLRVLSLHIRVNPMRCVRRDSSVQTRAVFGDGASVIEQSTVSRAPVFSKLERPVSGAWRVARFHLHGGTRLARCRAPSATVFAEAGEPDVVVLLQTACRRAAAPPWAGCRPGARPAAPVSAMGPSARSGKFGLFRAQVRQASAGRRDVMPATAVQRSKPSRSRFSGGHARTLANRTVSWLWRTTDSASGDGKPISRMADGGQGDRVRLISDSVSAVHDALWAVAALGGHMKTNGEPGWLVLRRGMAALLDYEKGWRAALARSKNCTEHEIGRWTSRRTGRVPSRPRTRSPSVAGLATCLRGRCWFVRNWQRLTLPSCVDCRAGDTLPFPQYLAMETT